MRIDPDLLGLMLVLFGSFWGFVVGWLTRGAKGRKQLLHRQADALDEGDAAMKTVLTELQDLRAHVADLTLMVDDSQPRRSRSDALASDE